MALMLAVVSSMYLSYPGADMVPFVLDASPHMVSAKSISTDHGFQKLGSSGSTLMASELANEEDGFAAFIAALNAKNHGQEEQVNLLATLHEVRGSVASLEDDKVSNLCLPLDERECDMSKTNACLEHAKQTNKYRSQQFKTQSL